MVHVEQEPPLLPGLDLASAFGEETRAAPGREPQVDAPRYAVTQRLDVGPEVKVGGEEEGKAAGLDRQMEFKYACSKRVHGKFL